MDANMVLDILPILSFSFGVCLYLSFCLPWILHLRSTFNPRHHRERNMSSPEGTQWIGIRTISLVAFEACLLQEILAENNLTPGYNGACVCLSFLQASYKPLGLQIWKICELLTLGLHHHRLWMCFGLNRRSIMVTVLRQKLLGPRTKRKSILIALSIPFRHVISSPPLSSTTNQRLNEMKKKIQLVLVE